MNQEGFVFGISHGDILTAAVGLLAIALASAVFVKSKAALLNVWRRFLYIRTGPFYFLYNLYLMFSFSFNVSRLNTFHDTDADEAVLEIMKKLKQNLLVKRDAAVHNKEFQTEINEDISHIIFLCEVFSNIAVKDRVILTRSGRINSLIARETMVEKYYNLEEKTKTSRDEILMFLKYETDPEAEKFREEIHEKVQSNLLKSKVARNSQ